MIKRLPLLLLTVFFLLFAAGCSAPSGGDEPVADPVVVEDDAPAEEEADSCALECEIGLESYGIFIPCESGMMTTQSNGETTENTYDPSGQSSMKLNLNQTRTYEETGNSYDIIGFIEIGADNSINYEITVIGGVYGEAGQTCQP